MVLPEHPRRLVTCTLLAMLSLAASPSSQPLLPDTGWRVASRPSGAVVLEVPGRRDLPLEPENAETMTSSASFDPAFRLVLDGFQYTVSADLPTEGTLRYITTTDPTFRSPEGVQIGHTLRAVSEPGDRKLVQEPGWACFVCLESGWAASFPVLDEDRRWIPCDRHDPDEASVTWFFKRSGTCSSPLPSSR